MSLSTETTKLDLPGQTPINEPKIPNHLLNLTHEEWEILVDSLAEYVEFLSKWSSVPGYERKRLSDVRRMLNKPEFGGR
jgi:hypothetical protein